MQGDRHASLWHAGGQMATYRDTGRAGSAASQTLIYRIVLLPIADLHFAKYGRAYGRAKVMSPSTKYVS